ncbi:MAG: flavodoxin family protein [Asgard group archaeon]|nr:flavodoxin family protein [Asgard group archaeon]
MKKVLILNGSPRKKGNTAVLVEKLSKILEESNNDVEIFKLNDLNIKPCQGCFWCYKDFPLKCVQDDVMNTLYPTILETDIFVFASPVYWYNYSGQLKLFIDRLVALHVKGGHALDGKKFASMFVYGNSSVEGSGVQNAINSIKYLIHYFKGENLGIVHGTAENIGDAAKNVQLLADVRELAEKIKT